jgi:hypothetical protein
MGRKYFPLLTILIGWFIILAFTGTIRSGYHLMDDHMIYSIDDQIQKHGLFQTIDRILSEDFTIRFRPLYWVIKILSIHFLGANLLLHSASLLILAVLTNLLLYKSLRNFGLTQVQSLVTSFLILVGYHSCIWWMLGPGETYAVIFLTIALYSVSRYFKNPLNYHKVVFLSFLLMASLTKESFVLLIPGLVLAIIFLDQKLYTWNLWRSVKYNHWFIAGSVVVFCFVVYFIVFKVGTNQLGYAGIDQQSTVGVYLKSIGVLLKDKGLWLFGVGVLINLAFAKDKLIVLNSLLQVVVVLLSMLLPQYILYARSGFESRYLHPSYFMLGLGFGVLLLLGNHYSKLTSHKSQAFQFLCILFLGARLFLNALPMAVEFTEEGYQFKMLIQSIKNYRKPVEITLISDPGRDYEPNYGVADYLRYELGVEPTYFVILTETNAVETQLRENFIKLFQNRIVRELSPTSIHFYLPSVKEKETANYSKNHRCEQRQDYKLCFPQY